MRWVGRSRPGTPHRRRLGRRGRARASGAQGAAGILQPFLVLFRPADASQVVLGDPPGEVVGLDRPAEQAEVAAALGVSRQTVISIESGRYLPSLPLAFRVARFFELPVDKMFDPSDEEAGT